MAFPIENKLVVAVSSSALFDLTESDRVYNERGLDEYRKYQEENIDNPLDKGVAFPFVKRLLSFNNIFPDEQPVEVVLLSRNSPETGLRVFRTIKHYDLNISRASFFSGESPYKYLPAFNASLFLSASERDVKRACDAGYAAGRVLKSEVMDDVLEACKPDHITGLSLLGGEPFEKENRAGLITLLQKFRERYPEKTVWCYTGFVLEEELLKEGESDALELLSLIDVLVDGRFVEELKNLALMFRGSSNQRIIDVPKTLEKGEVVLLPGKWERTMGSGDIYEV